MDAVVEYLASKNLLLLLDNCEHLLDASADLSATLLTRCPRLRVLATSREPLGVSGEVAWRVPSLQTLDSREQPSVDRLLDYEAARLFVERARLVQPEFGVTEANASALAEICRQLDGIPLAIELAAARVRVLTPEQIARRLDHDLSLLSGGSRTALPRQRTLKATLDWSYDLLDEPERALLGRLSVFAGGFRLEAADKVCSGEGIQEPQALDLLAQLVDKSLVEVESREREARYRLLEPIRQYAWEHLAESGEAEAVRRRHVAWLVEYVQQGERENYGPDERLWLRKVASEQGNVRAALRWCLDNDSDTGLLIAGRVWRYWQLAGHDAERQRWVGEMLSRALGRTEARRIVLFWSGVDARDRGDYGQAKQLLSESLAIALELGLAVSASTTLSHLSGTAAFQGEHDLARSLHEEAVALVRPTGNTNFLSQALTNRSSTLWLAGDYQEARALAEGALAYFREIGVHHGIGHNLYVLGSVACSEGGTTRARSLLEESLGVLRAIDDGPGLGMSLTSLGYVDVCDSDNDRAREHLSEALRLLAPLGHRPRASRCLCFLAILASREGDAARAVRLVGSAEAINDTYRAMLAPNEREDLDGCLAAARSDLGEEAFARAWAEGRAMSLSEAVECALSGTVERSGKDPSDTLSR